MRRTTPLTKLPADEVVFPQPTEKDLWMTHVDAWEAAGRVGIPPSVGQAKPIAKGEPTEYWVRREEYMLRPEVCHLL